jgi:peroxiredoxin
MTVAKPSARRRWLAAAWGAGVAGAMGAALPGMARATPAAKGEPVAWPEVRLLDGSLLAAPSASGKATVVVFFSTTCPFCARHNMHVQALQRQAAGLPLQVLGVAQDRDPEAVRRYLAAHGHGFAVTLADKVLHDALSTRRVIPLTCVIDRSGRLREVIPGEMFEEDVLELARWAQAT